MIKPVLEVSILLQHFLGYAGASNALHISVSPSPTRCCARSPWARHECVSVCVSTLPPDVRLNRTLHIPWLETGF